MKLIQTSALFVTILILSTAIYSVKVSAIETLSSSKLSTLCQAYKTDKASSESQQCIRYIKGFIDGAMALNNNVITDNQSEIVEASSFKERAIRTRIGNRFKTPLKNEQADFCLENPLPIKSVVTKVAETVSENSVAEQPALSVIFKALQDNYPCENV